MPETLAPPSLLEQLRAERSTLLEARAAAIEAREAERTAFEARTDATDDERTAFIDAETRFAAEGDEHDKQVRRVDQRVREQKTVERRRKVAARAAKSTIPAGEGVRSEPLTYREDNTRELSYFADLAAANPKFVVHMTRYNQRTSLERLQRHAAEMDVEMPKVEARRAKEARKAVENSVEARLRPALGDPFQRDPFAVEQRVTPNRTDGSGGYFIPPMWWNDFIKGLRPGRVTANLCKQFDMPAGTDVIVVPKLSTLTTVAVQGADNQPVSNTDWTDTAVTAQVKTLAGFSDIGLQLLDQSPYPVDTMIIQDLLADYDKKYDLQIVTGNASTSTSFTPSPGGQVPGLYSSAGASPWTSYNAITYTDGSPAAWKLFSVFGAMTSQIATNRFAFDGTLNFVVHPRRAWWFASATDSQNRPLVESSSFPSFNVAAIEPNSVPAEGLVTRLPWGPNVYASANVPTNDTAGGGSSQDVAIGFQGSDAWAFEGQMHTDVFPELLSGTLGVRFRVYAYVAFLVRYGQSVAIGSGSGFAAPTGAVSSVTF